VPTGLRSTCRRSSPAARTAASATASSTLAGAAASTANAKPRHGLIEVIRPGTVGEYDIWAVRPDSTGLRHVTQSPANRSDYYPAWSPDGSALLFERRKLDPAAASGDEALYAVNADGGDFRQITHCCGECWSDGEAARSPGGARIAFSRAIVRAPRRALRVAIDVANADGGLADEIDAAGAPRPSRACAPMATPGRRLAPGSASPARLLSNARDNVASPAVPHDNDRR